MIKFVSEIISTVATALIHGDQIIHQHQFILASVANGAEQRFAGESGSSFFADRRNNLWRRIRYF